ncbi:MAG TPA: 4'-phosphopantetheinyl transferase superfamily protein [Bacteroidales bacterium]|jgi:4'-phosphopantetheinyl transferase EntD|nr:4'-phosphopantetheinyl transferase superfamily protein [Bacteroidales bacterium]HRS18817.1 4'-phosphopantetheinyl transferase superfamily protein [Bacteroidales bacterium]
MITNALYTVDSKEFTLSVVPLVTNVSQEHIAVLNILEIEQLQTIESSSRKAEFVTSRNVLHSILGPQYEPIQYAETGKPYMNSMNISISHTKQFVAVIVSKQYNVAVDIEMYRSKIHTIASRFMNTQEYSFYVSTEDRTVIWCAKEVLFKLYNASPNFKEHYSINICDLHDSGTLTATLQTPAIEKIIELSYFRTLQFCLVWAYNS